MEELNTILLIGAIMSLVLRALATATYGRDGSVWLLTYLPILAVVALLAQFLVFRTTDFLEQDDWSLTVCLAAVMMTQLTAAIVSWWPKNQPASRPTPIAVPVHDAQVMAKLDEIGEQITALPDPMTQGVTVSDADVPVHDAKLMARIDVMSDRVTVTGDAVDALTEEHKS